MENLEQQSGNEKSTIESIFELEKEIDGWKELIRQHEIDSERRESARVQIEHAKNELKKARFQMIELQMKFRKEGGDVIRESD